MSTVQKFEDLRVWQDARALVKQIYEVSNQRLFRRDYSLRDPIRRAATSTMSNLAEGFERGRRTEFLQFLNSAKSSNGEVRSQLDVALDQEYLEERRFGELRESVLVLSRRLAKSIDYLETVPANSRRRSRKRS